MNKFESKRRFAERMKRCYPPGTRLLLLSMDAANTKAGVIRTPIGQSGWTHWLKVPYIKYIEESEKSTS